MGVTYRQMTVVTVTYECGHAVDFTVSPPNVGETVDCLWCLKHVRVISRKTGKKREAKGELSYLDPDN